LLLWSNVTSVEAEIDLLYAWRGGDRRAGDELMRAYYPRVFGFFRMRVPDAAEDLTQKTFLACTEGRDRVFASSFRAYVFGAAHKLLFKHLQATERQRQLATFKAPPPQSVLTPSGLVSLRQEHWLLLRALERLTLDMQVAIGLHYVEGLRAREVAEALEVPVSTITTRLARARAALQREVETLRAPPGVRETLAADLDNWVRSLGPAISMFPASR
jgi:RNA polymerase sigma-70 factor (ECF subfamily)